MGRERYAAMLPSSGIKPQSTKAPFSSGSVQPDPELPDYVSIAISESFGDMGELGLAKFQ